MLANIKKTFSPMPAILAQAQEGKQAKWNIILNGLAAFGVGIGSVYTEAVAMIPYFIAVGMIYGATGKAVSPDTTLIAQLFVTFMPIVILTLYVKA